MRPAAPDSVLCHFRLFPTEVKTAPSVSAAVKNLVDQVRSPNATLYDGDVTVRVDPAWGVSGVGGRPRTRSSEPLP